MATTRYKIHTSETDGPSATVLATYTNQTIATLSEEVGPREKPREVGYITIPLTDLARLGRVAQAILDGRTPHSKNYDTKDPE